MRIIVTLAFLPRLGHSLAWFLQRSAVTSVILGAKRVGQLEENLPASDIVLEPEELQ